MTFVIQSNRQIPKSGTLAGDLYYRKTFLSETLESKNIHINNGIKPEGFKAGGIKFSIADDSLVKRIDLA